MEPSIAQPSQPVLQTPRLRLRRTHADDADALYAIHSDPQVMRYWSSPAWTERQQAVEKLTDIERQLAEMDVYVWGIALRNSDLLIGSTALFALQREQGRAEIGYSLGSQYQGMGLGQEALRAVLGFAFDTLDLRRIEADIDPRNLPSMKLVERLGFVREGLLRERWQVAGETADTALYGLLRQDYRGLQPGG